MIFWTLITLAVLIFLPFGVWAMWMSLEADRSHRDDFWRD